MVSKKQKKKDRIKKMRNVRRGRVKIDEGFRYGPFEVVRIGKQVIMKNNATPEQHEQMLKKMAEIHEDVSSRLEAAVANLQKEISQKAPLKLMERAGYEVLAILRENKTESEFTHDEAVVLPCLEYLMYLISRTPVLNATELAEEDWSNIWSRVIEVFELTKEYLMTRAPKKKYPDEVESLIQQLDLQRLGQRVFRYPALLVDYWKNVFQPYDSDLQKYYGINSAKLVAGLERIAEYQKRGVKQRYMDMAGAIRAIQDKAKTLGFEYEPFSQEIDEKYKDILQSPEMLPLIEDYRIKAQFALTEKLFDITDIASLPPSVMDILSVQSGESPLLKLEGDEHDDLSPLSNSLLHFKPFLKVDVRYYTFYHSGLEDRVYELIERDILQKAGKINPKTEKKRSNSIERVSIDLLNKPLSSDKIYQSLHYDNPDNPGSPTELDGMIIIGDNLLLVEVKSGRLSDGTSRGAPKSLITDLKKLILEGQRQSERAENYIRSHQRVSFFDESMSKILVSISAKDFRNIFRVIVTNEQLGWVGAQIAQLSVIDGSLSNSIPWHVSFDDLMAIAELFEDKPIEFIHYLETRLIAAKSHTLSQTDEIDHVALYQSMNHYYMNIDEGVSRMTYRAYAQNIDKYFMERSAGSKPEKPSQKLPTYIRQIIDQLSSSKLEHRFLAGSLLLGFSQDYRNKINSAIRKILQERPDNRHKSVRLTIDGLSMGLSITDVSDSLWDTEKSRCLVSMSLQDLQKWLCIRVEKGKELVVKDVELLDIADYSDDEIENAKKNVDIDVANRSAKGMIARNQLCPCGSGERFKNCHGAGSGRQL